MLKTKNQEVLFKIVSCIFSVLMVVLVLMAKKVIDLIYLGVILIIVFKFLIQCDKK